MGLESEEFSLRRSRFLMLIVLLVAAAGIALANLASERVTVELLDGAQCERAQRGRPGWGRPPPGLTNRDCSQVAGTSIGRTPGAISPTTASTSSTWP